MAVRQECERRLADAKLKIKNGNAELATLTRKRDEAIAAGNAADAIRFKNQLKTIQESLEDSTITKLALEAKTRLYDRNEPEAVKVREQISAAWSQLVDVNAAMSAEVQLFRKTIREGLTKTGSLETEVKALAAKHFELIGETLRIPEWTLYGRSYHDALGHLADQTLSAPVPPWTYISETERLGAAEKQKAKAKAAQAARVKIAKEQAPLCKKCGKPMKLREDIGNDGEELCGSGNWSYLCGFHPMTTKRVPETIVQ